MADHTQAFEGRVPFEIRDIVGSDTGPSPSGSITFTYDNPSISTSTGGKFAKHEIIGGPVVRQRTGDLPLEVSINGVCKEEVAKQLELLRNARWGKLFSDRFSEKSVQVHFVSVSVDPLEDGGAAQIGDDSLLYSYSMECVELLDTGD